MNDNQNDNNKSSLSAPVLIAIISFFAAIGVAIIQNLDKIEQTISSKKVNSIENKNKPISSPEKQESNQIKLNSDKTENRQSYQYRYVRDKDGYSNLRSKPSIKSTIIMQVLNGSQVRVIGFSGNWTKVILEDGSSGYIYSDRLVIQ